MNPTINNFIVSIRLLRKAAGIGFSAAAMLLFAASAQATSLVLNGGFESTTIISGAGNPATNGGGQLNYNITATGWNANGGYTFLFAPGTVDAGGTNGSDGSLNLWNTSNGGNDTIIPSPLGGNFIASDPSYETAALTQTINGLTVGQQYQVGFYWAGAQQVGPNFTAPTTEGWQVCLGANCDTTPIVSLQGPYSVTVPDFSGWQYQTYDFTATGTSELLSFLAQGGPSSSVPPFSLLDGVSLTPAPEPGTLPLMFTGLMAGIGVLKSRKSRKS